MEYEEEHEEDEEEGGNRGRNNEVAILQLTTQCCRPSTLDPAML